MRHLLWFLVLSAVCVVRVQADTQYLSITGSGDVPLQVITAGNPDNPGILFVHGVGQSHFMFHRQFESSLSDDYYLVSFDLRGHGASGKPWDDASYGSSAVWAGDVAAVIAATGMRDPLIVAWSFGTLVALDYVREFGAQKISGMVFIGAIGALMPYRLPPEDESDVAEFLRVRQLQLSPDPRDQVAALKRMVDWLTTEPAIGEEREVLRANAMMFPAYARKAIYSRSQDNRDLLSALSETPFLFALGADDNPVMLEDAAILARNNSEMRLSIYDGAGHSVFYERPERFNAELRAFLQQRILSQPQSE